MTNGPWDSTTQVDGDAGALAWLITQRRDQPGEYFWHVLSRRPLVLTCLFQRKSLALISQNTQWRQPVQHHLQTRAPRPPLEELLEQLLRTLLQLAPWLLRRPVAAKYSKRRFKLSMLVRRLSWQHLLFRKDRAAALLARRHMWPMCTFCAPQPFRISFHSSSYPFSCTSVMMDLCRNMTAILEESSEKFITL
jgi:hypothetical protein